MEYPPESVTLSVVIPVYNEAATIATLLARVQAVPFEKEIILVDDGSTDGTWDVVQSFADVPNITLVRRARNQGKGAALRDGFARATNDIVIVRHSVNAGSDPSVRDSTASRGAGSRDWLAAVDGEATLSRNGDETVLTWVGREGLPERTGFRLDRDAWPWGIEVLDDAALAESTGGGGGEGGPDGPMSDKRADEVVLGALNGATPSQPTLISELRDAIVLELGSGVSGRGFVPFRASVDRLYQAGSLGASRDPTKRKSGSKLALWVSTKVERVEGAEKGQTPTLSRNQGVRKRGQEKGGDVVPPFSDPSHPVAGTNDPVVEKGHDPSESLAAGAADEWGASRGGWSPRPADLAEADDEASITGLWHFWTRHHVLPVDVGDACEHPISRYLRPDELAHWRALMVDYRALMVDYRAYEDARQTPFTVN